ncbi:hypothetical protein EON82_24945 [bacterium]|nr:MAG: hypothetical protein EON82_24945 [bacterium]
MNGRVPVLFDRALRPEWIDYALERFLSSPDEAKMREELHAWLDGRGYGVYTVQKTARQLQRIVGFLSPLRRDRLEQDYDTMSRTSPDERNNVRLQLIADSNPFFADCARAIRTLKANGAESVTVAELYERLQAIYGYRGMIPRRVRYVLQTLALFGCLVNEKRVWRVIEGSWLDSR